MKNKMKFESAIKLYAHFSLLMLFNFFFFLKDNVVQICLTILAGMLLLHITSIHNYLGYS